MATWKEILTDPKYADTTEITTADGLKLTVGDLRKEAGLKADFTKHTQQLAAEKQALESKLQEAHQTLAALAARSRREEDSNKANPNSLAEYDNDPYLKPVIGELSGTKAEIAKTAQQIAQIQQALENMQKQWWFGQHLSVIGKLQERDPDFKDPEMVTKLIQTAAQKGISNFDDVHALMTRERDIKRAAEEAEKKAYERAKAEASVPHIPTTFRTPPKPEANVPTTFGRQSEMAALQDPDVLAAGQAA